MITNPSTREASSVTGTTPKKLFSGGSHGYRKSVFLRNCVQDNSGNATDDALLVRSVPTGTVVNSIGYGDALQVIYAGDQAAIRDSDYNSDIYVVPAAGGTVYYLAEEEI